MYVSKMESEDWSTTLDYFPNHEVQGDSLGITQGKYLFTGCFTDEDQNYGFDTIEYLMNEIVWSIE